MRVRAHIPLIGLLAVLLYLAAGGLLSGHPVALAVFGNAALVSTAALALGVIWHRRRDWVGCHRLFWNTIAVGVALWIIGHGGWMFDAYVLHQTRWLQWHTVFSLCGGIAPLVALLARPHHGVRPYAPATVGIDLAANGLLAVFIYAYLVLVPSLEPATQGHAQNQLLLLVQINRALLLFCLVLAAWAAAGTLWRTTYLRLATGAAVGFLFRLGTNLAIVRGEYQIGGLYDLAWIIPWLCYAWAALEAPVSVRPEHTVEIAEPPTPIAFSAIPVLLIPAIGYGLFYLGGIGTPADSFRVLLTSVTTLCGFALLTMRLAAQGGELQRTDDRLRLLAAATEQTGDLILITRADGGFEHANEAFRRALGYTRRELETLGFAELLGASGEQSGARIPEEVRAHGIWRGTLLRRRKDGSKFPAACTVVGLRNAAGHITHFVGVERDISDELRLRDQLVHSERLSAIGELVAGVAHEINNPLQTIVACAELMMDDRPGAVNRRDLELVRQEAARAGQIVRNLLTFVRRGSRERALYDFNQIVRGTVDIRQYHLRQRNITIEAHYAASRLPVLVDRDEIQQVVLNLLLNAEQAVAFSSAAGTITVSTGISATQYWVEVLDTGPGIEEELRGRIFEPFFTTKDIGEGTGLGLSISHGIATAHGGALELLESSRGARFRLTLPVHVEARPSEQEQPPGVPAPVRRALIVDDEASIRHLLVRLLQRRGFEVVEADTGEAALEINATSDVDLVICDVRMRGMNGFEIYRGLTAARPAVARSFIFITGDTSSPEHALKEFVDVPVLAKPFTAADLDTLLGRLRPLPNAALK